LIEHGGSVTIDAMPASMGSPFFVTPMAAESVTRLPTGDEWLYEVKFDGYRALLIKGKTDVVLRSRNDKDLTGTYPGIASAGGRIRATTATLDGEVVAIDASGRPSFQALQHRSAHLNYAIAYYAFDLLSLDGTDLMSQPLMTRRARLGAVVRGSGILLSEALEGNAEHVVEAVRALGLEGVVAKRKDSRYVPGIRSTAWLKLKLERQQEFVIGGYRPGPHGVDALLVGYYDAGRLRFAGKVRAGFTPHVRRQVAAELDPLRVRRCPFIDLPYSRTSHWGGGVTADEMAEMFWVTPTAVAQIRFVEWTSDGHLRHAAFAGMRGDKAAVDVRREE
jgi:bifunctional non-homologous end joining protein LigD